MYRVLLKSMNFGAPGNKVQGHDGAAAEARTFGNRTRTEPDRNLTDWVIQHNRSGRPDFSFTLLPAAKLPLFLPMSFSYLSAQTARRNEASHRRFARLEP
jgi:hypothetical protein